MSQKLSNLAVGAKVVDTQTKYNGESITWLIGGHIIMVQIKRR